MGLCQYQSCTGDYTQSGECDMIELYAIGTSCLLSLHHKIQQWDGPFIKRWVKLQI